VTTPNEGRGEDPGFGQQQPQGDEPRVVVRDRRRIDPETGQVRPPAADDESAGGENGDGRHAAAEPAAAAGGVDPDEHKQLQAQLDERTSDLQRLTAEYANYRKRVDRDREQVVASAKAGLVTELLSVLDDVERAAAHGDLTGAFKSVADKLVAVLQRAGLTPFGEDGEPFDPSVHEAVQHETSPDVSGPTVTAVLRRGYRFGDRVVRAALVGVTDHEPGGGPAPEAEAAQPAAEPRSEPTTDADDAATSESVGPHGTSAH
jgi:molecular chaperone GrpE